MSILGKIKRKFHPSKNEIADKKFRAANTHNNLHLKGAEALGHVICGRATYGTADVFYSTSEDRKLIIGNYCSIASGVKFLLGAEHGTKGLSTYPFCVLRFGEKFEGKSKGDIIIKDDVWLGFNATILSGVTIGQGAVVGAGAVVTKDVPPYAIVGGCPAKVIRYRFKENLGGGGLIKRLLNIDIGKLFDNLKKEDTPLITGDLNEDVLDALLKKYPDCENKKD